LNGFNIKCECTIRLIAIEQIIIIIIIRSDNSLLSSILFFFNLAKIHCKNQSTQSSFYLNTLPKKIHGRGVSDFAPLWDLPPSLPLLLWGQNFAETMGTLEGLPHKTNCSKLYILFWTDKALGAIIGTTTTRRNSKIN
jgi:hypothetical protein